MYGKIMYEEEEKGYAPVTKKPQEGADKTHEGSLAALVSTIVILESTLYDLKLLRESYF